MSCFILTIFIICYWYCDWKTHAWRSFYYIILLTSPFLSRCISSDCLLCLLPASQSSFNSLFYIAVKNTPLPTTCHACLSCPYYVPVIFLCDLIFSPLCSHVVLFVTCRLPKDDDIGLEIIKTINGISRIIPHISSSISSCSFQSLFTLSPLFFSIQIMYSFTMWSCLDLIVWRLLCCRLI